MGEEGSGIDKVIHLLYADDPTILCEATEDPPMYSFFIIIIIIIIIHFGYCVVELHLNM